MSELYTEPVAPWRRNPDCFICGLRAFGVVKHRGFFCYSHYEQEMDAEFAARGFASGYERARVPWGYWLASCAYVTKRSIVPSLRRQHKRSVANEKLLKELFKNV